jgi:hypothetical protein
MNRRSVEFRDTGVEHEVIKHMPSTSKILNFVINRASSSGHATPLKNANAESHFDAAHRVEIEFSASVFQSRGERWIFSNER